ncbi:AAA family ATPase [Aestuariivivens sediminis]|uniref:AAA family ATPase n=1 Tax=Aestuariivivens sediminis TaxID=2913557 RepID=UPI001F5621ED|nr:AAA family ATPase [Aestuariivivens sediminis]
MTSNKHLNSIEIIVPSQGSPLPRLESPFNTKSLSDLIEHNKSLPKPRKLIGEFIYLHEQTMLFSPTGLGKSLLAFQIALCACRGESLNLGNGVSLDNEVGKINTLLFDFELSNSQLIERIGKLKPPKNLYISKIERGKLLEGSPEYIFKLLKQEAEDVKAKFIIVDNISKIGSELEKSDNAKKFMSPLWDLARHEGYTILVIAHTTKMDKKFPITSDSLGGSSKLSQLADALIGINEVNSKEGGKFYIKQIKTRNSAKLYGKDRVICTQIRPDENGLVRHFCYKTCHEDLALIDYKVKDLNLGDKIHAAASHKYYGSYVKASKAVNISDSTLKQRANSLEKNHKNIFNKISKMTHEELMRQIEMSDPQQ